MTTISVIIPVWNRAETIGRAIDSVLEQRLPAVDWSVRIIVVDDGSIDDLPGALRRYGSRITLLRHERNAGAAAARNTGIAAAHGEYVAFLDSDDIWLPEKTVSQLDFMRTHQFAASCTSFHVVRPDRTEITPRNYPTGALGFADFLWGCFVSPGSTLICRRDVYGEIGAYDVALRRLEDWDWLLRYAARHHLGFLDHPLARIEISPSGKAEHSLVALEQMEVKHLASLSAKDQRRFRAAVEIMRAAALRHKGKSLAAALAIAKSLWIVPRSNVALANVVHNTLAKHRGVSISRSELSR
jgi:glycosyltransferase involved in cell wall biosynthesis